MNKFLQKVAALTLGLAMASGVCVVIGNKKMPVKETKADELTFDVSSNPGGWPTTSSSTATNYTYTLNNVSYTFSLKNVKSNSGYLMLEYVAALGLPAIQGKKLTKVIAHSSSGHSTSTEVGISSSNSSASYINGGAKKTWSTKNADYTYNLTGTSANTMYYLYVTNKNSQVTSLKLTYETVGTTHKLTYAVGEHGEHDGTTTKQFDLNESTGTQTVKSPAEVGITAVGAYAFDKWNDGSKDYAVGSTFTMGKADATLEAIWVTGIGLSYNGNGATSGETKTTYVKSGESQTVSENGFTFPSNKVFKEWNTNSSGTGISYSPGDVIEDFDTALELFAIWQDIPTYTRVSSVDDLEIGATYLLGGTLTSSNVTSSYFARSNTSYKNSANWLEETDKLSNTLADTYVNLLPEGTLQFTLLDAGKDGSNNQLYYMTNLSADEDGNYHSLESHGAKLVYWNENTNNTTNAFDKGIASAIIKWAISIDGTTKEATIHPLDSTDRFLCNTASPGDVRFDIYASTTTTQADRKLPFIYKLSGSSFETSALSFATTYLKMGDSKYDGEVNTEDNPAEACANNYSAMKVAYGNLNAFVKNVFLSSSNTTLSNARARAAAWADANTEVFNLSTGAFSAKQLSNALTFSEVVSKKSAALIIAVISLVSVGAIGGYFFIHRRKEI